MKFMKLIYILLELNFINSIKINFVLENNMITLQTKIF